MSNQYWLPGVVTETWDDIAKADLDNKSYRIIELSNKMRILLISDPKTIRSLVALRLNIGGMVDPEDLPGLSHLCEHMVHYGSWRYSDPLYNYLKIHAGYFFSFTALNYTFYSFNVRSDALEESLDRFAHMFVSPAFIHTEILPQVRKIHSEYQDKLNEISNQIDQLIRTTGVPGHPFGRYIMGNLQTLNKEPLAKDIDMREQLDHYFNKYYSSNIMSAYVVGAESLDELETMSLKSFCEIKNKNIKTPRWDQPFAWDYLSFQYNIVLPNKKKQLILIFPLDDIESWIEFKPAHYLIHMLRERRKGTLSHWLQLRKWATSIEPKLFLNFPSVGFDVFYIAIGLTENGTMNIDDIIKMMFFYIDKVIMKNTEEIGDRVYDFYKKEAEYNLNSMVNMDYTSNLMNDILMALLQKETKDILRADNVVPRLNFDKFKDFMFHFKPGKINIYITGESFSDPTDLSEKWFGTKYGKLKMPPNKVNHWHNIDDPTFHLILPQVKDRAQEGKWDDIPKAITDRKSYRIMVLKNKLKVLLISDPEKLSGPKVYYIALRINIGSMHDPDDMPGLARFCQLMLFCGSKKYPHRYDSKNYFGTKGIETLTLKDHSLYYMKFTSPRMWEGTYRFIDLLTDPLFDSDCIEDQVAKMESEFQNYSTDDSYRIDQIIRSSGMPDHSFAKFVGNRKTLESVPIRRRNTLKFEMRKRVLEFFETYYSANIMTLCVAAKDSLDNLETFVRSTYSKIKNNNVEVRQWSQPFTSDYLNYIYYIIPIQKLKRLIVRIPLPDLGEWNNYNPVCYVSYMINKMKKLPLLTFLKMQGWCDSIKAGLADTAKGFDLFEITFDMTDEGLEYVNNIVALTIRYIKVMRNTDVLRDIYYEVRKEEDENMRYKASLPYTFPYMKKILNSLETNAMEDILLADERILEFNSIEVKKFIDHLLANNILVYIIQKPFPNVYYMTEKWFGTRYAQIKTTRDTFQNWNVNYKHIDFLKISENLFMTKHYDLLPFNEPKITVPQVIDETEFYKLWYLRDYIYKDTKAFLYFNFISPIANLDVINSSYTRLWIQYIKKSMKEYSYMLQMVIIDGYENYDLLIRQIYSIMASKNINEYIFKQVKDKFHEILQNSDATISEEQARYHLHTLLIDQIRTKDEYIKAMRYLNADGLENFIKHFFNNLFIECFIHGNITSTQAKNIIKVTDSDMRKRYRYAKPLFLQKQFRPRHIKLEDNHHFVFRTGNSKYRNSCIITYYPCGTDSPKLDICMKLLSLILEQPNSSYIIKMEENCQVNSYEFNIGKTRGFAIAWEDSKYENLINTNFTDAITSAESDISEITKEEFYKYVTQVRNFLKITSLEDESKKLWYEISEQRYKFSYKKEEDTYLSKVTKETVQEFCKEMLNTSTQRLLTVHVITEEEYEKHIKKTSSSTQTATNISTKEEQINDIYKFKKSQYLYPPLYDTSAEKKNK